MDTRASRALVAFILGALSPLYVATSVGQAERSPQSQHHSCIFDQQMLRTESGICRPTAVHYPRRVKGVVRRAIYDGALTFGIPYTVLLKIAKCESSLNPRASYAGHFGLFQFLPQTFTQGSQLLGRDTGIVARNYWNARDASYVAGYLFATGRSPAWACELPV